MPAGLVDAGEKGGNCVYVCTIKCVSCVIRHKRQVGAGVDKKEEAFSREGQNVFACDF